MGTNMGGKDSKRALIRTGTRRLARLGKDRRGEGYVDMIVLVLCAVLVLALAVRVLPVYIAKQRLDTFATELVREAEITGNVGSETERRAAVCGRKQVSIRK